MKRFSQFLVESQLPESRIDIEKIYGEFRQAGIHAGNRLSESPLVATRGFAALNTAAHKIEQILREHGILLHQLTEVDRPDPSYITMKYALTEVIDERKIIGSLFVRGNVSPVDKGTVQFHAEIALPQNKIL